MSQPVDGPTLVNPFIPRSDEDCRCFQEALLDAAKRHRLVIHVDVFMTNHMHLLACPGTGEGACPSKKLPRCETKPILSVLVHQ